MRASRSAESCRTPVEVQACSAFVGRIAKNVLRPSRTDAVLEVLAALAGARDCRETPHP
jgi:hypothetical protein